MCEINEVLPPKNLVLLRWPDISNYFQLRKSLLIEYNSMKVVTSTREADLQESNIPDNKPDWFSWICTVEILNSGASQMTIQFQKYLISTVQHPAHRQVAIRLRKYILNLNYNQRPCYSTRSKKEQRASPHFQLKIRCCNHLFPKQLIQEFLSNGREHLHYHNFNFLYLYITVFPTIHTLQF